jgi:hypothetical protein
VPPPVSIPSQLDPVHTPTSHFLKIPLYIMLPSTPWSLRWSLSLRFPHQNTVYTSPLPHTHYMPHTSYASRFYHPQNSGWEVQIINIRNKNWYNVPLVFTSHLQTLQKFASGCRNVPICQATWAATNRKNSGHKYRKLFQSVNITGVCVAVCVCVCVFVPPWGTGSTVNLPVVQAS